MSRIWFRVGMECLVTEKEMSILTGPKKTSKEKKVAKKTMKRIIKRAVLSGETYVLGKIDSGIQGYDNPENEVVFYF